jgi:hypothetical protein
MSGRAKLPRWKFLPRAVVILAATPSKNFRSPLVIFATCVGNSYYQGLHLRRSLKYFSKTFSKTVRAHTNTFGQIAQRFTTIKSGLVNDGGPHERPSVG